MYPNQPGDQPQQPPTPPAPQGGVPPQPTQPVHTYVQPGGQPPAAPNLTPGGMASIDYLNQIAPQRKRGLNFSPKQLLLLGGALLLALGVLAAYFISNASGPNLTALSQSLIARSSSIEEATKESQGNIQGRELSTLNSSLSIQLTSTSSSLNQTFTNAGINVAKIDKSIIEAESNAELLGKLQDARLSGTFDRVYLREMSYELEMLLVLINDAHTRSRDETMRTDLETAYKNLDTLRTRMVEIGTASE